MEKIYCRTEIVEDLSVEYFSVKQESGGAFGVGICETQQGEKVYEDVVHNVFSTQTDAEECVIMLANHTVLAVTLRDVLCNYFVEKLLA